MCSKAYFSTFLRKPVCALRRPKEGLFQAQTSRYLSEFEEICRLGKGSYGNVFKVYIIFVTFFKKLF